jgi:hypothetical protein
MFQLTVVVIEVGWWCWPCDERCGRATSVGMRGGGKYTKQTRDDGSGNADQGWKEEGGGETRT